MDHNLPSLSSTYTDFVSLLDERLDDITVGLDPGVTASLPTNLKVGAIRWSSDSSKWQKYAGGTTWNDLAGVYAISISGQAANAIALGGLNLANTESGSGPAWNTVPRISTTGLTEIGGSLDFHNTAGDVNDYSIRLSTGSSTTDLYITPQGGASTKVLTVANILSNNVSISGNAGTVSNGVYTIGTQTISGTKTFSNTIIGSISGNAATVTNGVYTSGSYANPAWITSLAGSKITGDVPSATKLITTNWIVEEVLGVLEIKTTDGTLKLSMSSTSGLTVY